MKPVPVVENIKICINCKHFSRPQLSCTKIIKYRDLVLGELMYEHARFARSPDGVCGPDGKLYEPKERVCEKEGSG